MSLNITGKDWPSSWPKWVGEIRESGMRGGNAVEKKGKGKFKTLKSSEFPVAGGIQAKIRWLFVI